MPRPFRMMRSAALAFLLVIRAAVCAAAGFSFVAMSDSRGAFKGVNAPVLRLLVEHALSRPGVRFIAFPGDMVNGGKVSARRTRSELEEWRRVMAPAYESPVLAGLKVYPGIGNHEVYRFGGVAAFRKVFPELPQNGPEGEEGLIYSFDHGNAHFVMLDTNQWEVEGRGREQAWRKVRHLGWLRADLAAARGRGLEHIFVFGHEPAFPVSAHHVGDGLPNVGWDDEFGKDPSFREERDAFWALLKEFDAAAYVCGHEHANAIESVQGLHQILAGGAGAPLYEFLPCAKGGERYREMVPYYKALGYPHGEGDNCQASADFWGSRSFGYFLIRIDGKAVTAEYWGVEPKDGSRTNLPKGAELRLMRS
ncbi:MAG: metallophosphoesterase, partial [Elusimicrobiota bacterium]